MMTTDRTLDTAARTWLARRSPRWSMPVCLQPRAPRRCRVVRAEDKRPVPLGRYGYRVRPGEQYQVELDVGDDLEQPAAVAVVAGPVRRTHEQEQRVTEDDRPLRRLDFQVGRGTDGAGAFRSCWSRLERMVLRLEYTDGRDDYEHPVWLHVAPRRLWAFWAVLSSAILYGLVPWLSRLVLEQGDLPAVWSRVLHALSRPALWQALVLAVVVLWLILVVGDRLLIWHCGRREREKARGEVQCSLERLTS
jgi:hypothetical protein